MAKAAAPTKPNIVSWSLARIDDDGTTISWMYWSTSMCIFCVLFAFISLEFLQEQTKLRDIGKGTTFNQIAKTSIDFFSTLIFSCIYPTLWNRILYSGTSRSLQCSRRGMQVTVRTLELPRQEKCGRFNKCLVSSLSPFWNSISWWNCTSPGGVPSEPPGTVVNSSTPCGI